MRKWKHRDDILLAQEAQEVSDRARNRNHISHVLCRRISLCPCPVTEPLIQTKTPTQDPLCWEQHRHPEMAVPCSGRRLDWSKISPTMKVGSALCKEQLWGLQGREAGSESGLHLKWMLLVGVSRCSTWDAQDFSVFTQQCPCSLFPACSIHLYQEIEFTMDLNTFKSIYCKITFQ